MRRSLSASRRFGVAMLFFLGGCQTPPPASAPPAVRRHPPVRYPSGALTYGSWMATYYPEFSDQPTLPHRTLRFLEREYDRYLLLHIASPTAPQAAPPTAGLPTPRT